MVADGMVPSNLMAHGECLFFLSLPSPVGSIVMRVKKQRNWIIEE